MSARYIPLAVSTTPSRCRRPPHNVDNPRPCRQPPHNVDDPLTVSTTRAHARARRMPQSGLGLQLGEIMPPAAWGIPSEGGEHHGMPYFLLQWEELNERCPLVSRDCLCPPRVRGTPARARAGRASALSRPDARGNARTRQGWPVLAGDEDAQAGERPHAPGLVPGPASPRLSATPGGTRTRTLIYRTRTAHKGAIPPLCAAPCSLIPFLVCDTEKERGQDPRGTRRTGHSCCTA